MGSKEPPKAQTRLCPKYSKTINKYCRGNLLHFGFPSESTVDEGTQIQSEQLLLLLLRFELYWRCGLNSHAVGDMNWRMSSTSRRGKSLSAASRTAAENLHDPSSFILHGVLRQTCGEGGTPLKSQFHRKSIITGWWFQTCFIFHHIWDNPSHWLIFFRGVGIPPSRQSIFHFCWVLQPKIHQDTM